MNVSYHIPYSFMRQDAAVAQTTFYGVAGLKSLANHQLRSITPIRFGVGVQMRA